MPDRYFLVTAFSMLGVGVAGVFGLKAYIAQLHTAAQSLESSGRPDEATALRVRQNLMVDAGVMLAMLGLAGFVALIVAYAD